MPAWNGCKGKMTHPKRQCATLGVKEIEFHHHESVQLVIGVYVAKSLMRIYYLPSDMNYGSCPYL